MNENPSNTCSLGCRVKLYFQKVKHPTVSNLAEEDREPHHFLQVFSEKAHGLPTEID